MCYINIKSNRRAYIIKKISKNSKKGQKAAKNSLSANTAIRPDNPYNKKVSKGSK